MKGHAPGGRSTNEFGNYLKQKKKKRLREKLAIIVADSECEKKQFTVHLVAVCEWVVTGTFLVKYIYVSVWIQANKVLGDNAFLLEGKSVIQTRGDAVLNLILAIKI